MGTSQNGTQWSSCEYTIEELNEQYPSRAVIQVYGSDKIQQFGIQLGEIITAHIGLKARQSKEGRWFNQLDCWKVERPNVYGSDKIQQFGIQLGEIITAHIGLKARQSKEGRWFNQLDCWKVERPNGQQQGLPFPAPNQ